MPRKSVSTQQAATENPDWYASPGGRRQTQREFERALTDGTLRYSSGEKVRPTNPAVLERLLKRARKNDTQPK